MKSIVPTRAELVQYIQDAHYRKFTKALGLATAQNIASDILDKHLKPPPYVCEMNAEYMAGRVVACPSPINAWLYIIKQRKA